MISLRCFFRLLKVMYHNAGDHNDDLNDMGQKRTVGDINRIVYDPGTRIAKCPKTIASAILLTNAHGEGYTGDKDKNVGELGENKDVDRSECQRIDGDEPIGESLALALKEVIDDRLCCAEAAGYNTVKCAGTKIACRNEGV